jgi:hypothetical protein
VTRNCEICGTPFEAQRPTRKFCGPTCRQRNSRGSIARTADVTNHGRGSTELGPPPTQPPAEDDYALVDALRAELEAAGVVNSRPGQQALLLAEKMCEFGTGGGTVALSRELQRVRAEALQRAHPTDELRRPVADDFVDELQRRRERKRGMR